MADVKASVDQTTVIQDADFLKVGHGIVPNTGELQIDAPSDELLVGYTNYNLQLNAADDGFVTINSLGRNITTVVNNGTAELTLGTGSGATYLGNGSGDTHVGTGAGSVNVGTSSGTVNVGATATARSVNVGTGAAAQSVIVGDKSNASSTLTLRAGGSGGANNLIVDNSGGSNFVFKFGNTVSTGGGVNVIFVGNFTSPPTSSPSGGGLLYSQSGAGKWKGTGGSVTTFGAAGPHCGNCGYDAWRVAVYNTEWKSWHFECANCDTTFKGGPKNVLHLLTDEQKQEIITTSMDWPEMLAVLDAPGSAKPPN